MLHYKTKNELGNATRASVTKEMAKPRLAKAPAANQSTQNRTFEITAEMERNVDSRRNYKCQVKK